MDNECFIKRLIGVSDSSELKEYNTIVLRVNESSNPSWARAVDTTSVDGLHIKAVGITLYSDPDLTNELPSEIDSPSGRYFFYCGQGDGYVHITGKYGLTIFNVEKDIDVLDFCDFDYGQDNLNIDLKGNVGGTIDDLENRGECGITWNAGGAALHVNVKGLHGSLANINKIKPTKILRFAGSEISGDLSVFADFGSEYKTALKGLSTGNDNDGKIYGNIEALADYVNFEDFDLAYCLLTGNIATACGNMTKCNGFNFGLHSEAEDLKTFFDSLYNNGKVTGTITLYPGTNKTVTYNGQVFNVKNTDQVTFNSSGWVFSAS